jgi:cell division protease FtsH
LEKRTKFSIGYYAMAVAGLILLQSQLLKPPAQEISYSTFRSYLKSGSLQTVEIGREFMRGTALTEAEANPARFRVRRIPDEQLIPDLETQSVEYKGIDDSNWLLEFLGGWLLPFTFLAAIWMFL